MKRLKAGDTAMMVNGASQALQPGDVRPGRVVLWPDGAPYATTTEEIGGRWKVVVRPFIVARKTAEADAPRSGPTAPVRRGPRPPSPQTPNNPDHWCGRFPFAFVHAIVFVWCRVSPSST